MHLPPLPSITTSHVIVTGDVSIDKSAAIAPGVILQADPDSRIIIAAGVCIGMGAILHAHKGILEIDAGAILGAGVLVVGVGKIGANACIGAATTIWNSSVDSWQVLPAGSMVGETGRKIADNSPPPPRRETPEITPEIKQANLEAATATEEVKATNFKAATSTEEVKATNFKAATATEEVKATNFKAATATEEVKATNFKAATSTEEVKPVTDESVAVKEQQVEAATSESAPAATAFEDNGINGKSAAAIEQPTTAPTEPPATPEVELTPQQAPNSDSISVGVTVYGQAHLNRLLLTLFPYKSATNPPKNEE
ncbi:hexapeptide repeat-containing transferase [Microseira wollei NIES-4236]|uniref:Hexapeptide repeat-containing transferase n=2 Tax=Microseira wollei TaxID=467598 RepID=A0AAV3XJS9_9CYAN|nr:hexapeptide repeat-containing transferase [Microseira wollei NIES-4236]